MANRILAYGTREETYDILGNHAIDTGGGDSAYSDSSMRIQASTSNSLSYMLFKDESGALDPAIAGERLFCHGRLNSTSANTNPAFIGMVLSDGALPLLAIMGSGTSSVLRLCYNSAATGNTPTWVSLGNLTGFVGSTHNTVDVFIDIGVDGHHKATAVVGAGETIVAEFDQPRLTKIDRFGIGCPTPEISFAYWTEMTAAVGISLIGARIKTIRPNAAGTYAEFTTNAIGNVNEVVNNDATYDRSAAAGQRQSYNMTDVTVPATHRIGSVKTIARVQNDGTSPNNVKQIQRVSGQEFTTPNYAGIGPTLTNFTIRKELSPVTNQPWTQTEVNSLEVGYQSAA